MLLKCPVSRAATHMPVASRASSIALPFRRPCRRYREARRIVLMAENNEVVASYANALATLAESESKLEEIHSDMDRLAGIIRESSDLQEFLSTPSVAEEQIEEVLTAICQKGRFHEQTESFIRLVAEKGRTDMLPDICEGFEEYYCQMTETQVAVLKSAQPLGEAAQYEIAKKLQKLSGAKNVKLKPALDPSLIGGFVVEFDSDQIDMSVKGQLGRIANDLKAKAPST